VTFASQGEKAFNVESTKTITEGNQDDRGQVLVSSPDYDWLLLRLLEKLI
jgi:hypothetical protein